MFLGTAFTLQLVSHTIKTKEVNKALGTRLEYEQNKARNVSLVSDHNMYF